MNFTNINNEWKVAKAAWPGEFWLWHFRANGHACYSAYKGPIFRSPEKGVYTYASDSLPLPGGNRLTKFPTDDIRCGKCFKEVPKEIIQKAALLGVRFDK